jgi:hypothetical protein
VGKRVGLDSPPLRSGGAGCLLGGTCAVANLNGEWRHGEGLSGAGSCLGFLGEIDPAESIGETTESLGVVFRDVFITLRADFGWFVDETPSASGVKAVERFGPVHRLEILDFWQFKQSRCSTLV